MEFMSEAFVVLAILLVVGVAAFSFEPANPLESWLRLAQSYGTGRQPSQVSFPGQDVLFGAKRGGLKKLSIAAEFDATVDDFGFWLTYKGPLPEDATETIKIPGTHVRFVLQNGDQYVFELFAEPPVTVAVKGELGATLMERCRPVAS